ncbi:MAG TPA: AraC family transcriptional regulator ligand-binding domain-containing protein [Kofleriaceae bacterium]|nr:AraC family transcriptional regulator ligand-binding domain-containing protein [Kofleriaceae bacterium]
MDDLAEIPADTALASPAFTYVDVGVAHGLPRDALMAAGRLDEAMRADPDARVSTWTYVVLWRELLTKLPEVVVPVELVRALDDAALGVTAQLVLRADDLAQATDMVERFLHITDTGMQLDRPIRGDHIGFAPRHRPEVMAMRFPVEVWLGTGFQLLSRALGGPVPLVEVTFAHPAGYPVAAYEELFGAPVRFDAEVSALWLPRAAMTTPFAGRDPLTRRYLEAHAAHLLANVPAPVPALVAMLREAILVELATSGAELARVARRVAMSTRTVQRRLEELGTSYQDLVEDLRASLARTLLRDRTHSIVEVALELGYADLKSFYRAFRRWTGMPPGQWRATQ